ncbi:MAG: substrate-binding domain-containing protein [Chloroflexia bacterium]|nr:substrate-binding domain-containing protein [Chloroflexia bacterium]
MKRYLVFGVVLSLVAATVWAGAGQEPKKKAIKLGTVLHIAGIPFCEQIATGARDAGKDLGVHVEITGPSQLDAAMQISMFNTLVAAGYDGISNVPYPAEQFVVPIQKAREAGALVTSMNVSPMPETGGLFVGHATYLGGIALGEALLKQLKGKKGDVIIGITIPGAPPLEDRAAGVKAVLSKHPEFRVLGPFDVGADISTNYNQWQNLYAANPNAIALIGVAAQDVPNLSKIRKRNNAKFVVGGFDLEPETLTAIKEGFADVTVGQHPYLQGYLPIKAMYEKLTMGKEIPNGWIDVGSPIIDATNIDEILAVESDPKALYDYYNKIITEQYSDLSKIVKPLAEVEKR